MFGKIFGQGPSSSNNYFLANEHIRDDIQVHYLYFDKSFKGFYVDTNFPARKNIENTFKVYFDLVQNTDDGAVIKFTGKVNDVGSQSSQHREENALPPKESAEVIESVKKLFPQVKLK